MAKFTVRVELHRAREEDYECLHQAMEGQGFKRTISDNDGTYHLPTAEYSYVGNNEDKSVILGRARSAAEAVGRAHAILVTKSAGRTWHGLAPVR